MEKSYDIFISIFSIFIVSLFIKGDFDDKIIIGLIIVILMILFIPGLRLLVFGLAGIASFFAMVASIIHFQILGAMAFLFLGILLFGIANIGN